MTLKILQLSDAHLFADPKDEYYGVNPYLHLQDVITHAKQSAPFDLVISTGDIAQQPCEQSYQHYFDIVSTLQSPHIFLRGNHDDGEFFPTSPMFDAHFLHQDKVRSIIEQYCDENIQLFCLQNWFFILLNSQTDEGRYGLIAQQTLEKLKQVLNEIPKISSSANILLALHHQPVAVGSAWIDAQKLKNSDAFFSVINEFQQQTKKNHPQQTSAIKAILHGHVHQAFSTIYQQCKILACPSTFVKFIPLQAEFAVDKQIRGYQILHLHDDGQVECQVFEI